MSLLSVPFALDEFTLDVFALGAYYCCVCSRLLSEFAPDAFLSLLLANDARVLYYRRTNPTNSSQSLRFSLKVYKCPRRLNYFACEEIIAWKQLNATGESVAFKRRPFKR